MKLKHFALCAIAAAIVGCDTDSNNNDNNLGSIALTGTPTSGQTLSAEVSDPDGISGDVTYYWYADGEAIVGANSASFTLTDEQIGLPITVQGLYTDDGGINESHITDPTANVAAIAFMASVTISGDATVGSQLTANVVDENGFDSDTVVYQWFADSIAIEDEVLSTLILTEAQFGSVISVSASFEDDRGFVESATSAATQIVERTNSQGEVTISGTPTIGNTLTAQINDADGATGSIAYQWFAEGEVISDATQITYVVDEILLGKRLTVQVTYTDDNGFSEDNVSDETIPVSAFAVDEAGSIAITGVTPYLVTNELSAQITDNNGVDESNVTYTWFADGVELPDTNSKTFTPANNAGAIISVSATYTDNDGFASTVTQSLDTVIYTQTVNNPETLLGAVSGGLANGSVIGLNTGVYADMDAILLTSAVTLKAVEGQVPVISGELCVHVADGVDGAGLEGLTFKNIDTKAGEFCESEETAVIYSEGDNFTFSHNIIDAEETELNNSEYHWIMIKGQSALVERNTFSNRNVAEKGSVIKMSSSSSDHIIQYNLFSESNNPNFDQSSLYLINAGSTTGTGAADDANFTIQYNRVENFVTGRRLIRVQTSGATIKGNTILNANGGISLEDGGFNTVTDNIIIRTTNIDSSSDRPAGVIFTPLGHTVSNNYIAGIRSGNKEAGGIVFTANPFSQADGGVPNSGNQAVLDAAGDLTLTVTNNTVLNSQQPIVFSTEIGSKAPTSDCDELTAENAPVLYGLTKNAFVINFNGNLIANGLGEEAAEDEATPESAFSLGLFYPNTLDSDHAFEYDCDLINHDSSVFSNNFGYMDSRVSGDDSDNWVAIRNLNGNGSFDTDGAIDQNPGANNKEVLEYVTVASTLIETDPAGAQAVAGAKELTYIQSSQVGAGSTWTAENN
ncbi:poly(beta-D-mannuronate) lyase [Pseudoalteromonas agarivorans]|uniref:poly(beta-D-mannuronate) lyase n=1 Tax=Pseudoalteromonas agarivorans TaxID=176102 RepID=UPI00311F2AD4